ncbi:tRNA (adenosine(37)-N6)-threonylcarbamoyltransferase complex ATPase subunit type 1 TsaE [Filobacillus milosensis]|uniref:tRNA threonylcarbamoyladenosine biosynthesis protein TsaE n=1 Tax=Filobacillus milosensis TaxID=94137 RepID=A0A4Y8ICH6_9BACI|nr:tRNA (adenosine(37)-N6)-threonylcarbamoyltransferase complex ATPase subunit type 1 TsaE [Filobacillus milosensis]TFB13697.1 tRNA (adenosine(37)-N6)-threonylcarbamoyltransferase complex ATPase subunit type 1 TsaE [Filobacillus milosensis]
MYKFIMKNETETQTFASKLANFLKAGDVITLDGDLGAGKTTFTKGLAKGLEVIRTVNSPTYTIVKEYKGRLPLFHMDVYRLEDSDEDIGFDDYFNGQGISVIEWAKFIEEFLPEERLDITINKLSDIEREIHLIPNSDHFKQICEELQT